MNIVDRIKFRLHKSNRKRNPNYYLRKNSLLPTYEEIAYDYTDVGSDNLIAEKYGLKIEEIKRILKQNKLKN